ncbi:MAG: YggS family pyridoxal phosphate-dependent enzyme [Pseudomonadota bacterium]
MTAILSNLQAIRLAITRAAADANREASGVHLLAVSKTFPAAAVREAYLAGQVDFGENYVQEALQKIAELSDLPLEWHFIGPIQSNKTRAIAENFAWVHSVSNIKVAERLSAQRPPHLPALNVCLQVNISGEESKNGVDPKDVFTIAREIAQLPYLNFRGLMAIPAPTADAKFQREPFAKMNRLLGELKQQGFAVDTLSMGMSHDFATAIKEGSTFVRIGTAIFGARHYGEIA